MKKVVIATIGTLFIMFAVLFLMGLGLIGVAHQPPDINSAIMISVAGTIIGAIALFFWGIPVHFYLKHKNKTTFYWYALSGFLPGFVVIFIFQFFGSDTFMAMLFQSLYLGVFGAIFATVFWLFIRFIKA